MWIWIRSDAVYTVISVSRLVQTLNWKHVRFQNELVETSFCVIISGSVLRDISTIRFWSDFGINVLDCLNLLPALRQRLLFGSFVVTDITCVRLLSLLRWLKVNRRNVITAPTIR